MLQSSIKMVLFAVFVLTIAASISMVPALGQTSAQSNLEKRNYAILDDQHLTARFGNNKVCGDHLCAPGEWSKLQENLNQAQISHTANATTPSPIPSKTETPSSQQSVNSTISQSQNMTVSTPPSSMMVSSAVCAIVKADLGNSTSSSIVEKIMEDLGCAK